MRAIDASIESIMPSIESIMPSIDTVREVGVGRGSISGSTGEIREAHIVAMKEGRGACGGSRHGWRGYGGQFTGRASVAFVKLVTVGKAVERRQAVRSTTAGASSRRSRAVLAAIDGGPEGSGGGEAGESRRGVGRGGFLHILVSPYTRGAAEGA